ncbi:DHH family phosphoesterase [Anaerosalibacter massiliensis]|uniref:Bifunctional oligoribonuclease/PAP phosphatase NrnA n=1 Tax=Anaerosalibacter massiliensis TaxID=1347392 RepID=A0A9X2MD08_9FIRM|nr:bifunctional oligoribonuclease/PAP phosphatase NrnA [Anaerosalibacter massiliensis]MCR2042727.1 bifunctional oligoribonuclease/PAP phosphatase NrnA [Anaerosalibacter massiliensis]
MNRELNLLIDEFIDLIKSSNNIYLASHVQPDGDNIGSLLALGRALEKMNKDINIVKVDSIPKNFQFLPNMHFFQEPNIDEDIDLFIALDSGDMERLGVAKEIALKSKKIVNIDHHITNNNFGDLNIVSPLASSTGEIVYHIIKEMNIDIDEDIATCIYVAISTDTGSFMYDSTTMETHLIAADLLDKNIDLNKIIVNIYQSKTLEKTKLFIKSLNTLKIFKNGKIAIVKTTQKMLNDCGASIEDAEGLVSFIRDIEGVEVACILKEIDKKEIKISLRSKKEVDVSKISLKFNGGGHKRAAGCTIYENIDDAKKIILKEIYNYI